MESQYGLGPVKCNDGFFIAGLSCGLDLVDKICKDFAGEITASPVKSEFTAFSGSLQSTLVNIFDFGERKLFFAVVGVAAVRAGGSRSDQWLMVTEDVFVIQIKIIVADTDRIILVSAKCIVKSGIQMIILSVDSDNVPGMAVFDTFFGIISADGDNTPDSEGIAENFYGFGDSLTDADTMAKRSDDLMGVWLFQFVIADILEDKVVDIFFLIPFRKLRCRAYKLLYAGVQSFLVLADFVFVKNVFGDQDEVGRILIMTVFKSHSPEDLRMIQTKLKKNVIEPVSVSSRDLGQQDLIRKIHKSCQHCPVCILFILRHSAVVIFFSLFHI